jgi:tripartite-type tricarboxylate transporter receptor subunit TctC
MLTRRRFFTATIAGFAATTLGLPACVRAQALNKTARIVVGFPAGGSIDAVARLLVNQMRGYAPSIVVENKPGAGGRLALDTLQFLLTVGPMVPTHVQTLTDFIAWSRANPKLATYGTAGAGTRPHFLGEMLARAANFPFMHVPYKGAPPAMQDLLAGQVASNLSVFSNALPHVQAGKLRALATTAERRNTILPDVPTFREAGFPSLEAVEVFGLLAPARTPDVIIEALASSVHLALATDEVKTGLARLSFDIAALPRAEFAALIASDSERWRSVVQASGFKPID